MTTTEPTYTAPPKKKGPNKILIGCLVAVVIAIVLFVGLIVMVFSMISAATKPATDATDTFFKTTATQGPAAAYALTAPAFQATVPEAAFEALTTRTKIAQVDHESWNSTSINNDAATLSGTLYYKGGGQDAVTVTLQKSGDAWKVSSLEGPAVAGASGGAAAPASTDSN